MRFRSTIIRKLIGRFEKNAYLVHHRGYVRLQNFMNGCLELRKHFGSLAGVSV